MPLPLPADVIARIVELRQAGIPATKIAAALGVSRSVVFKHSTSPAKLDPARLRGPGRPPGRLFYDDPRFIHPPEDEYADVTPIPFFPDDLPRLESDPFQWTSDELSHAVWFAQTVRLPRTKT